MTIRPLKKDDIAEVATIVRKNYSKKDEALCLQELAEMFGVGVIKPNYFVAVENKKIVGFCGYMQSWMDYSVYQIFWLNVLPEKQKLGVGTALMRRVLQEIQKKKDEYVILLTAETASTLPTYYKKNFKFKTLLAFNKDSCHLMALSLHKT